MTSRGRHDTEQSTLTKSAKMTTVTTWLLVIPDNICSRPTSAFHWPGPRNNRAYRDLLAAQQQSIYCRCCSRHAGSSASCRSARWEHIERRHAYTQELHSQSTRPHRYRFSSRGRIVTMIMGFVMTKIMESGYGTFWKTRHAAPDLSGE